MKIFTAFIAASFALIAIGLASCNQTAKALNERIDGADSIAINYFDGGGKMDSVLAVKIIRDKKALEQLTGFIIENSAPLKANALFNGSIHFFKNDMVVQDVYFCDSKECSLFIFSLNGKKSATRLTKEAGIFLSAIQSMR